MKLYSIYMIICVYTISYCMYILLLLYILLFLLLLIIIISVMSFNIAIIIVLISYYILLLVLSLLILIIDYYIYIHIIYIYTHTDFLCHCHSQPRHLFQHPVAPQNKRPATPKLQGPGPRGSQENGGDLEAGRVGPQLSESRVLLVQITTRS